MTTYIFINSAITVRSWNAGALDPSNTIIDGQSATRCMYLNNPGNYVAGFTLRNGNSGEEYGAASIWGAAFCPIVTCIITRQTDVEAAYT